MKIIVVETKTLKCPEEFEESELYWLKGHNSFTNKKSRATRFPNQSEAEKQIELMQNLQNYS